MRVEKGQKVDWAQIIFNSLCNELDQWFKYVKDNKGDKKDTCQFALILAKKKSVFVCASKGESIKTIDQG